MNYVTACAIYSGLGLASYYISSSLTNRCINHSSTRKEQDITQAATSAIQADAGALKEPSLLEWTISSGSSAIGYVKQYCHIPSMTAAIRNVQSIGSQLRGFSSCARKSQAVEEEIDQPGQSTAEEKQTDARDKAQQSRDELHPFEAKKDLIHRTRLDLSHQSSHDLEHRLRRDPYIEDSLARKLEYAKTAMEEETKGPIYSRSPMSGPLLESEQGQINRFSYSISHTKGNRGEMEDEHIATKITFTLKGSQKTASVFGILDGHGGKRAAKYVKEHFAETFQSQINQIQQDHSEFSENEIIWNALKLTYVALDDEFYDQNPDDPSGTTATIAFIYNGKLWTANSGDSRAFLMNPKSGVLPLTEDMKPANSNCPSEITETSKASGFSNYTRRILKRHGCVAILFGLPRVDGQVAVAGAIGDKANPSISPRPAITRVNLSDFPPDTYLFIGCDGVFEAKITCVYPPLPTHTSTRQVAKLGCDIAADQKQKPTQRLQNMSDGIVEASYHAKSGDNISAIVVAL